MSAAGALSSMWWPSDSSNFAAAATAASQSGCDGTSGERSSTPMRSLPGSAPTSSSSGRSNGGATYGSPGSYPEIASSTAAVSRTLRVTHPSMVAPAHASPINGAWLTRPLLGFRPTSPHSDAGTRNRAAAVVRVTDGDDARCRPRRPSRPTTRRWNESRFHGLRDGP